MFAFVRQSNQDRTAPASHRARLSDGDRRYPTLLLAPSCERRIQHWTREVAQ